MKCFYCKEVITWSKNEDGRVVQARYAMIGIDVPYINLFFHIDCIHKIENINLYLTENIDRIYDKLQEKTTKKRK